MLTQNRNLFRNYGVLQFLNRSRIHGGYVNGCISDIWSADRKMWNLCIFLYHGPCMLRSFVFEFENGKTRFFLAHTAMESAFFSSIKLFLNNKTIHFCFDLFHHTKFRNQIFINPSTRRLFCRLLSG